MKGFLIFLIIIFIVIPIFPDNIDLQIAAAVNNMENNVLENMIIGVGNIVYSDNEFGSEFSSIFKQKLFVAIQKSERFELSDTDNLDLIREQWDFQHSGLVDENQAVRIGELDAVQALLLGKYFDNGYTVNVFLNLLDIENGSVLYAQELVIAKRDISVSIIPDNLTDAVNIKNELSNIIDSSNELSLINAWIERGNGATYKNNEELIINFFSNTGCYIKIFHIDVNGDVQLIFPNEYYSDNYISANTIHSIPDSNYPFKFNLGEPFGTEFIKVMASTVQFSDIEEAFSNLGSASRNLLTRGLTVEQKEQLSELLLNYTIIP